MTDDAENPPPSPLPILSNEDVAAVLALVIRYTRLWDRRELDKAIRDAAVKRIADQNEQFEQFHSAFAVFGFDTRKDAFPRIREFVGEEVYANVIARARATEAASLPPPPPPPPPPRRIEDAVEIDDVASGNEDGPSVRELTLEYLKAAGDAGHKASEIQALIEGRRKTKLHPKTAGMTLYRLSQDGLARRDGRTWFFVSAVGGTKNPGGGAPGSSNVFD